MYRTNLYALPLALLGLLTSRSIVHAQDCSQLKPGQTLALTVTTYPPIMDKVGASFYTMKPKKKAEAAEKYSEELASGSVKPASSYDLQYTVGTTPVDGELELATTMAGQTYKSYVACKDGVLYLSRVRGIAYSIYNGDTLGFSTLGTQIIPATLKPGDLTPGYVDESIMTYSTSDIRKTNFAVGDASYSATSGSLSTSTYSGYVNAKVDYSVKGKILKLYQSGIVLAQEPMTVGSQTFNTYKVRTEIWTKNDTKAETNYELSNWFGDAAFNKQIHSQMQANAAKASTRVKASMDDMAGTNKAGYVVTFKEEWIAPGIGAIKTDNYDQWGCLTSTTLLKAIN